MKSAYSCLVISKDDTFVKSVREALRIPATTFRHFKTTGHARRLLMDAETPLDAMLIDESVGDTDLVSFLECAHQLRPEARIVIAAGLASIGLAVVSMKLGASDVVPKSSGPEPIVRALTVGRSHAEIVSLNSVPPVERMAWDHIQQVLHQHHGNISACARALHMHRRTLQRKLTRPPR